MKLIKVILVLISIFLFWLFAGKSCCSFTDAFFVSQKKITVPIIKLSPEGLYINHLKVYDTQENIFSIDTNSVAKLTIKGSSFCLGRVIKLNKGEFDNWQAYLVKPDTFDIISLSESHSLFFWKEPLKTNFMTGHTPDRYRYNYYSFEWKKPSGASLVITWRYEQYFWRGTGWNIGDSSPLSDSPNSFTSLKITPPLIESDLDNGS